MSSPTSQYRCIDIPEVRVILGYLFPSWEAGLAAMQEISTSDAHPSITRVSDAKETAFSLRQRKSRVGSRSSSLISKSVERSYQQQLEHKQDLNIHASATVASHISLHEREDVRTSASGN